MRRLLIANRGEIARRIARSCAVRGVAASVVFSDADAFEPFVLEADEAYHLPGTSPAETYLNRNAVLAAALALGVDAVHPGYGFLSEDATFARMCGEAGITFVGPPAAAIEAMGSKLNARAIMANAGVPMLPAIEVVAGDPDRLMLDAQPLGLPILVKASHGGGGRGMRVVESLDELPSAVTAAAGEAQRAFGSGVVYLERYLSHARHIEVQILADQHGDVRHVFDRDCSVQRRHQKILEEAPSYTMPSTRRASLMDTAVAAARAVNYIGAGTVEFLVDQAGEFYFLEMNTRLQVEHPVTETITGIDLVAAQLSIADGSTLRDLGLDTATSHGHAIEARLYAEDVFQGFAPMSGTVEKITYPLGEGIRVDAGIESGSTVSTHYDAMLAKIIAWAPTRSQAIQRLGGALRLLQVDGVTTNRDLLIALLNSGEFRTGNVDTGWLDTIDCFAIVQGDIDTALDRRLGAVAAALAGQAGRRARSPFAPLPTGWRNNPSQLNSTRLVPGDGQSMHIEYRISGDQITIVVDQTELERCRLWSCSPEAVDLEVAGVRRRYSVRHGKRAIYVDSISGHDAFSVLDRYPSTQVPDSEGTLRSETPGTVIEVLVTEGQRVAAGDAIVKVESMKMEQQASAPHDGIVTSVRVAAGDQIEAGTLLVVLSTVDDAPQD